MCGIAGILQKDSGSYSQSHLQQMTDALAHRGPDGEASWKNDAGTVLLGHRRLSIIDLSEAGQQPMHYTGKSGSRYTVIHNGEIYNYIELRNELKQLGYQFHSQTDTEVITAAYDQWQDNCVDHFDGMFAFAIWDEAQQELFAARDRFGEKPFFYYFRDDLLIFASEIKAFWSIGIARVPNQQLLFNFITIGYTDNPAQPSETFYEDIFKLPAASILQYNFRTSELNLEKYWEPDPEKTDRNITTSQAIERFEELFTTSIRRRLRSDVAIGASLSGGLDSSSIVAMATSLSKGPLNSFTADFPGYEKNEAAYADMVNEQFHLSSHHIPITAQGLLDDWEQLCYSQDEPFGSASIYAQYKVYALAKQHQIKVLLDGQGADETLAGYAQYYKWFWQELFRQRKLFRSGELKAARTMGISERFGWSHMIAAYFPGFATVALEQQYLLKAIRQEDLTKEFVKLQSKEAYYTRPDHYTLNSALHFNTSIHGLEELLRFADRNAMAHGREVRLPFLSHELVEFLFTLPATMKIHQGWTKWLLRESMKNRLPGSIVWRKDKTGFEPPQANWMKDPAMQDAIRQAKKKLVSAGVLKPAVLEKAIQPLSAHAPDNYDWRYFSAASLFS